MVSQYFWPENFRVNDLVTALVQRGHEVTVLTGQPNYPEGRVFPEFSADPTRFRSFAGADVIRVPMVPRGERSALRLLLNYASFALMGSTEGVRLLADREFDSILVYQPSPITSCLPALAVGRSKRAPVLLWTLDLWPETLQAIGVVTSPALLGLVGRLVTFIYSRCALVLGQSRAFEENVTRLSGDPGRFRYFPQWAEPLFSETDGNGIAPELLPFSDTFNVLFAGNIGEAQDFPAILDAAERLRQREDIRWLIVGDGRAAGWVRAEIGRRDLGRAVHLLGRHPIQRMPAFYRGADALLVSLKRDPVFSMTIPGKVQTYLASGVPLLGMLDGEGARVIDEAGAGLTAPAGDAAGLAANVERLAALEPGLRSSMGTRGLAYAREEFDRGALLQRLEGWMESCALEMRQGVAHG